MIADPTDRKKNINKHFLKGYPKWKLVLWLYGQKGTEDSHIKGNFGELFYFTDFILLCQPIQIFIIAK